MIITRRILFAAAMLGALLASATASAQATRTWVSGVGDDVNPCSRVAPCKTFAGAISKTAAGGEIDVLDPGGFGSLTITKSITIDGHAALGGVLVAGTNGINVNAGNMDVVTLRGLTFTGVGSGLTAIKYNSGLALHVEDCTINGFVTSAIDFQPMAAATLFVKNVTAINNALGLVAAGMARVVVTRSHFFYDGIGLHALGSAKVAIHDSVFSSNSAYGLQCEGMAEINMDQGLIAGNGVGVQADSTVRLSEVMVGHNTTGVAGNSLASFGNNRLAAGNGADGNPKNTLPQQ